MEAAIEAAHLRFRPIIMTSLAFILGVLPLVIAGGAGSASQRAIGTGVMGGMITATMLGVLFVPVFFVVVRTLFKGSERQRKKYAHEEDAARRSRGKNMIKNMKLSDSPGPGNGLLRLHVAGAEVRAPGCPGGTAPSRKCRRRPPPLQPR